MLFCPLECFFDSEKKLNNYVLYVGNYKISQKKSSYNVFSETGASFGGIAHIYIYSADLDVANLHCFLGSRMKQKENILTFDAVFVHLIMAM